MIKEYKIKDVLNAVDRIRTMKKNKNKSTIKKNDFKEKNDILSLNNPAKTSKSEILVLDQMIE
tara:strand:- start:1287 stop:1475 length:189 start_codon:yes stop_codon:yes gene_type:complete